MMPTEFRQFLQQWDDASKSKRADILNAFIQQNDGKTAPELELALNNSASLFFTRLTAWLRLSYVTGQFLKCQLKCILVFVGASNGFKFLSEFIEVGGILTLLEILGLSKVKELDKEEALKLLNTILCTGRKYKELVCESFGVRAVCECLAKSDSLECQEACRTILVELTTGNPKYLQQIYKSMIMLLKSISPEAQQIAAQLLQLVQPMVDSASIGIVDPALTLLRSLHVEVQYESCLLIKQLITYDTIKINILKGLVGLLKPSKIELKEQPEVFSDPNSPCIQPALPVYIQQAVAAKMIGILSKECPKISTLFVKLECVTNLLFAMGNDKYADSQKQAALTLQHFIHSYQDVESSVRYAMGQAFFFEYMNNVEDFYLHMTSIQLDILRGNKVIMDGMLKEHVYGVTLN